MRKIIIIGPALSMGGMERASVNVANSLAELGCEVTYIAIFKKAHFFKLDKGIKIIEPEGFNVKSLAIGKTISWLRTSVKAQKPDSVLAFNKFYAALTALALTGTGIRLYLSERSSPLYKWASKIKLINRVAFSINPPAGVIAQTNIAAEYQKKYYGSKVKIKVVPNALRDVKLYPGTERGKNILAVGRFGDALKGFDRLTEAFGKLGNKEWKLTFAGGEEQEGAEVKSIASKYNAQDSIEFLGKVSDLDPVYARSGIFVIPSRSEGFPNALCEAMAAGMPCISFDFTAGPRDIITNGHDGILVEDGNTDELAKAMARLIADDAERLRLGENAKGIAKRLDKALIGKEIYDFIQ